MVAKLKKDRQDQTLITHDREPCLLVQDMANESSIKPCHTGSMFMVAKLKKKDRLNLTLMTHDREPCQLVPNMANDSSIRAMPYWQLVYVSQIKKKRQTKPNPNGSWLGTLSIGPKYG